LLEDLLGVAVGLGLVALLVWWVVLRPRWRLEAFCKAGAELGGQGIELREALVFYQERRKLGEFLFSRASRLSGFRLVLSAEHGHIEVDLLRYRESGRKSNRDGESLVAWAVVPGGPELAIQKSEAGMPAMHRQVVETLPALRRGPPYQETGIALDEAHLVFSEDMEAARARLEEAEVSALMAASDALARLTGRQMSDLVVRTEAGYGLMIPDPAGELLGARGLSRLLAILRPLAAPRAAQERGAG